MAGPTIHIPRKLAAAGGFWVADFDGGTPTYVDAHPEHGSTVASAYPVVDGMDAYRIERALDWILNAAGAGAEAVARAFRAAAPGSRVERAAKPSEWWDREFHPWAERGHILAIEFSQFFGKEAATASDRSLSGLVIDDADDNTTVTGFLGGSANSVTGRGQGPGGGGGGSATGNGAEAGGSGGHGRAGSTDLHGDPNLAGGRVFGHAGGVVPAAAAIAALVAGNFTAELLALGGGGGAGRGPGSFSGGDGGDGLVRVASTTITETTTKDLSGDAGAGTPIDGTRGGHGSGGGYYAISRLGFTLNSGVTIDLRNGGDETYNGNGRLTTFTVDQPTISGTVQGGVATHFQVYPARPRGGLLVM